MKNELAMNLETALLGTTLLQYDMFGTLTRNEKLREPEYYSVLEGRDL